MKISKDFALRFNAAAASFKSASLTGNEALISYHLGLVAGLLATILPEAEAEALIGIKIYTAEGIAQRAGRIFDIAEEILSESAKS